MKFVVVLACLLAAALAEEGSPKCTPSPTTASGSQARAGPYCSGDLIFEDNFNHLDFEKWEHENTLAGGGNWEFQWYTNNRANSYCENGIFYIRPTAVADDTGEGFLSSGTLNIHGGQPADLCTGPFFWGCERAGNPTNIVNPIKSARVRTVESFNFKFGKLEVRAKMPTGDWLWPAVWLLPKRQVYGSWPASGEIDLVESRGNLDYRVNGVHIGVEQVGSTLHFGPNPNQNGYDTTLSYKNSGPGQGFNTGFHLYQLEWTPDHITFSVDNQVLRRIDAGTGFWSRGGFVTTSPASENPWMHASVMAPFDQEFYIIMNLAVGGTNGFFPDVPPATNGNRGKPYSNNSPAAARDFWNGRNIWQPTWQMNVNRGKESSLQVDYVRVWAL
ncbi:gram-negative bacteria binding protein [Culex quinquefasciatus]|uniref:Gram-negative bacteria binding protein n=1 Tax=Culex quinquefasciatus TaxID=7176 RepID=B0WB79_CULQU|nr:beta-1,3-glucan-binding protein [Culex quinquefasciatus]XP_039441530.1 beta-1,3-glucan-binding protein-like [Culex pipiens pallens]EDS42144.1 gram-negative bacteria binding protein [Culex quinquefasciatus]|eukprot:XP_001845963.1 gram-negative bacteria binding protein [Culex quinquefasciatus]